MKNDIQNTLRWVIVMACVFAPFLIVGAALLQIPGGLDVFNRTDPVDWIWLILLGGMMLGVYYFLAVYLEDEEKIHAEFHRLDGDGDGYISREDAARWPDLVRSFDRYDADHDGRLSRVEFENFEHHAAVG